MKSTSVLIGLTLLVGRLLGQGNWNVVVDWDNQIFPSYIIATSVADLERGVQRPDNYIGDLNGFVGVEYIPDSANEKVQVEITGSEFVKNGSVQGVAMIAGKKYRFYPKLAYDYLKLGRMAEPTSEDLTVSVNVNGESRGTIVKTVRFRSVNDCPLALLDDRGKTVQNLSWMFAAYVNENHPLIDEILGAALKNGVVRGFKGYQGTASDVVEEVFAVWNTVQRTGVRYSSITTATGSSKRVFSQYVRKLEDCVRNSEANCVDGSALFASVFRRIGLHTSLVLIPGHCFLLVYLDDARKQPLLIETTVIGEADLSKQTIDRGLNSLFSGRKNNLSRTSFEHAVAEGTQKFNQYLPYFGRSPGYYLIDIEKTREIGLLPLNSSYAR